MNKKIMESCGFEAEMKRVEAGNCPCCNHPVAKGSFRDAKSEREFTISGLCQDCQDQVWGMED